MLFLPSEGPIISFQSGMNLLRNEILRAESIRRLRPPFRLLRQLDSLRAG
jgi:hypothetical protein